MKKLFLMILIISLILTSFVSAFEFSEISNNIILRIERLNYYKPIEFNQIEGDDYSVGLFDKLFDYGKIKLSIESNNNDIAFDAIMYKSNTTITLIEDEYRFELQVVMNDGTTLTYLGSIIKKDQEIECNILSTDKNNYTIIDGKKINSDPYVMLEAEPNNAFASANSLINKIDMYGTMQADREDYFKIIFTEEGTVNFWLANIPTGKNHNLYVYEGTTLKWSSTTTTGTQKLLENKNVKANTTYYIRINYPSGTMPTGQNYKLNVRMLPKYTWPVDYSYSVNYCYEDCVSYSGHNGVDCYGKRGDNIYSFSDGNVFKVIPDNGDFGNFIEIRHLEKFSNGKYVATRYAHIDTDSNGNPKFFVEEQDEVKKGDIIALIGSTGKSSAPHLHFEVLFSDELTGPYVRNNPLSLFPNVLCDKCDLKNYSLDLSNYGVAREAGILINDSFIDINTLINMNANDIEKYGISNNDLL
jgi:murein DD-endopeptidase MepM/ murein hydrolase activator NlpD